MSLHSPVVIVSGLPRSGTSLLMQMLQAGGAPLLMDECRAADANNPRGYFEFAPAKGLRQDATWLSLAVGKAVKVVSPLLVDLPTGYQYRVLFIHRDLTEVIASQNKMLADRGVAAATMDEKSLLETYGRAIAQTQKLLAARKDFLALEIDHGQLLASPTKVVPGIVEFLQPVWPELPLDQSAMIGSIDPQLYRVRR